MQLIRRAKASPYLFFHPRGEGVRIKINNKLLILKVLPEDEPVLTLAAG
jgi:hypothetical protein